MIASDQLTLSGRYHARGLNRFSASSKGRPCSDVVTQRLASECKQCKSSQS